MTKFSGAQTRPNVSSPMRTTGEVGYTHEGGAGFKRDAKTELFLLAATNMVREDTFYESANARDTRFEDLIHAVTQEDPQWIRSFIPYLRNTLQMRSASIVMAAEYLKAGGEKPRSVINSALSRADEPAEILAYWAQKYGKNFPMPLKRGVADAVERLYTEFAALKYDGASTRAWRMGDVIDIVHPKPLTAEQSALFKYLIDARHKRDALIPDGITPDTPQWDAFFVTAKDLPVLTGYHAAMKVPIDERRNYMRGVGIPQGMTWESLSGWLNGPMDAEAWEAVIPQMGYMALLRNLRNFENASISQGMREFVRAKLIDPEEVAKSRQFPIRFYSAWKATEGSLMWGREIEKALDLSVANIPTLRGRSLILVDVSGSMYSPMSQRSTVDRWELAGVFGSALALRNKGSDLVAFGTFSYEITPKGSVLQTVDEISRTSDHGGTNTWQAVERHFAGHDRIIILTDEQTHPYYQQNRGYGSYAYVDLADPNPARRWTGTPIYTFNLAGYEMAHAEQGQNGSYVFGGLTDAGFKLLQAIDELSAGSWPFELGA